MQNTFPSDNGFLATASDALRELMSSLAKRSTLKNGEVLFEQGDTGDTLYAIISGALEFSVLSSDGRKLRLDVMHDGALFGEIALFDPGPRTATVMALEPTQIWGVKRSDVLNALRKSPELGIDMIQLAGRRMRWMGFQLSEQVFLNMPARLARKLLHLTENAPSADPVLKFSQAELADFVGASREAVSKTLGVWKRKGIIEHSRGELQVLDTTALKKLADFPLL